MKSTIVNCMNLHIVSYRRSQWQCLWRQYKLLLFRFILVLHCMRNSFRNIGVSLHMYLPQCNHTPLLHTSVNSGSGEGKRFWENSDTEMSLWLYDTGNHFTVQRHKTGNYNSNPKMRYCLIFGSFIYMSFFIISIKICFMLLLEFNLTKPPRWSSVQRDRSPELPQILNVD